MTIAVSENEKLVVGRKAVKPRGQPTEADFLAKGFEALGESTRLRIMRMLPQEPVCDDMYNVIELAEELGLTQPTISHHLKILSQIGLVRSRRQCSGLYYYVNKPTLRDWLRQAREALLPG